MPSNVDLYDAQINRVWVNLHFGAKFVEEVVDRCKQNSNTIWEGPETVVCRRGRADIFRYFGTVHEHDRQTDRQAMHGTVTLIAISEIAC